MATKSRRGRSSVPARKANGRAAADASSLSELPVTERILSHATRLFAEKGFLGTSVQEIVDAASVTKGALYHHYSSKDDLLLEVYNRVITKELDTLERVSSQALAAPDALEALMRDVMLTTAEHKDDVLIFLREMHRLPPEKLATVRANRRKYHLAFRGVVEQGQKEGVFRPDVPAELVTITFFGLVHHYYTWYRDDARFSPEYMANETTQWFLNALAPAADTPDELSQVPLDGVTVADTILSSPS